MIHKYFIYWILCFYTSSLLAQTQLPGEKVKVVKDFEVKLLESEIIPVPAYYPMMQKKLDTLEYRLRDYILPIEYPAPTIRPIAAITNPPKESYSGYLKAGLGLPRSILGEGSLLHKLNEKAEITAWGSHTSFDNSRKIENQKSALNKIGIGMTQEFNNQSILNASLQLDKNYFNWFSAIDSMPLLDDFLVANRFTKLEAETKIHFPRRESNGLQHEIITQVYTLSNNYATRENSLNLIGTTNYEFSSNSFLEITLQMDASTLKDTQSQNITNILLGADYLFHLNKHKIKLGGTVATDRNNYFIFPNSEVQLTLNKDLFLFLGAEGGIHKNHFNYFAELNPFIAPIFGAINNDLTYHFFTRGQFLFQSLTMEAAAGLERHSNLPYFITDVENNRAFVIEYDQVNTYYMLLNIGGKPTEGMKTNLRIQQNFFAPKTVERLFGQPAFELNWSNQYSIIDQQLLVKINFDILGGIYHQAETGKQVRSNTLYDFSIGANYYFSKNWGAFVDCNNILNNKFRRWYQTPTFGTTFNMGLAYRWK
jgi:hypothetical protein